MVHTVKDKVLVIAFAAGRLRLLFAACVVMPLACVVGGCSGDGDARRLLDRAEVLMEEHPDSALAAVDSIDPGVLHSDCDRARYALLTTQAMVKNYRPVESDSLISVAVSYYRREAPSSPEMMKSLFYQAQVRYDCGKPTMAILPVRMAYAMSVEFDDDYWRAKCAELIADIYYDTFNPYEALNYTQEASGCYLRAGKIRNHRYALCDIALRLNYLRRYVRSQELLDSVEQLALTAPVDTPLLMSCLRIAMSCHSFIGDMNMVEHYDRKLHQWGVSLSGPDEQYTRLKLDIARGDTAGIEERIKSLASVSRTMSDSAGVIVCMRMLAKMAGDWRKSEAYTDSLLNIYNRHMRMMVRNSALLQERDFHNNRAEYEYGRTIRLTWILVTVSLVFLLVAVGGTVLYRYRLKIKNMTINSKIHDIQILSQKIQFAYVEKEQILAREKEHLQIARESFNKKIDVLFRQRWSTLNFLCDEYFEKADTDKLRQCILTRIEGELMKMKTPKSLGKIETAVNDYKDNVMSRMREQCRFLSESDITFLLLIIAGFSSRAVCLFTDIRLKNFYVKRKRLIDRIMASNAPDKKFFLELLM